MRGHKKSPFKETTKKVWNFIWNDDSIWSWLANVALAFILIKFIVYPLLGLLLGTQLPVVAVISESMSHTPTQTCVLSSNTTYSCIQYEPSICGQTITTNKKLNFENYWFVCGGWYENHGIAQEEFSDFRFLNGFEKGDVIVLGKANPDKLKIGDILVFNSDPDPNFKKDYPIIHRIVDITETSEGKIFSTKGDHNDRQIIDYSSTERFNEREIKESQVLGKGIFKIPLVGYIKLWFVKLLSLVGLV